MGLPGRAGGEGRGGRECTMKGLWLPSDQPSLRHKGPRTGLGRGSEGRRGREREGGERSLLPYPLPLREEEGTEDN